MEKDIIIKNVLKPIIDKGFDAFFVGGCVRDKLLNKKPKDFDVSTNASPSELHTVFSKFSNKTNNSEPYGVTIPIINGEEVEIASFRKDISDGRHPTVEIGGTINEDAARRDFTINSLYEDIDGNILDPTKKGLEDIKNKLLRFVGDPQKRILEDPLRILRFARFTSTLGFESADDLSNIKFDLSSLSKERVLKELQGMFGGKYFMPNGFNFILNLNTSDQLDKIKEVVKSMKGCFQNPIWHSEGSTIVDGQVVKCGNVFDHTLLVMEEMQKQDHDWLDMFAAFVHDIGKPECLKVNGCKEGECWPKSSDHDILGVPLAKKLCKDLGIKNDDIKIICWLVEKHMTAHKLLDIKSKYKIWKITSDSRFDRLVKLSRCDSLGCHKLKEDLWLSIDESLKDERIKEILGKPLPDRILTGKDLISKGFSPSIIFKLALEKAHEIQIDKGITDKEELFKRVKTYFFDKNLQKKLGC